MTITAANDINNLYNINSDAVKSSFYGTGTENDGKKANLFGSILNAAVSNITDTNTALSNQENEVVKWAMGISDNTHDLTMAVGKAQTALEYTIGLRADIYKDTVDFVPNFDDTDLISTKQIRCNGLQGN